MRDRISQLINCVAFLGENMKNSYFTLKKYGYSNRETINDEYMRRLNNYDSHKIGVNVGTYPAFFLETEEIRKKVLLIYKKDKEVLKLCLNVPKEAINHFIKTCLIDEIQKNNEIEGVRSTRKEIKEAYDNRGNRFIGIVNKYQKLRSREDIQLTTCEDIRNLYDDLVLPEVVEENEDNRPDGVIFRKNKVSVYGSGLEPIHQGLYPEKQITESMEGALKYLNNGDEELVYRIAVFHYLFGYIHPFYDGNGRLNRFISSYMLSKEFELIYSYRLSYTIKENQSSYNRAFKECNDDKNMGELTVFVDIFLDILLESIDNLIDALNKRKEVWEACMQVIKVLPNASNEKYATLYKSLLMFRLFTDAESSIIDLKNETHFSEPTLRKMLKTLKELSFVEETVHGKAIYYRIIIDNVLDFAKYNDSEHN